MKADHSDTDFKKVAGNNDVSIFFHKEEPYVTAFPTNLGSISKLPCLDGRSCGLVRERLNNTQFTRRWADSERIVK